jgi:DNA invertase Pin-like site-specific DNA recombinase
VVDFILELINTGEKTSVQITEEYRIPKTTLYKWLNKYNIEK